MTIQGVSMTAKTAAELAQEIASAKSLYKLARTTVADEHESASSPQKEQLSRLYSGLGTIGEKLIAAIELYNANKLTEADAALATVASELRANGRQFTAITKPKDHRSEEEVAETAPSSIFDGLDEEIAAARKGDRLPAYIPPPADIPYLGCVVTDEEVAAAHKSRPESPPTRTMQAPPANTEGGKHRADRKPRLRNKIAEAREQHQQNNSTN